MLCLALCIAGICHTYMHMSCALIVGDHNFLHTVSCFIYMQIVCSVTKLVFQLDIYKWNASTTTSKPSDYFTIYYLHLPIDWSIGCQLKQNCPQLQSNHFCCLWYYYATAIKNKLTSSFSGNIRWWHIVKAAYWAVQLCQSFELWFWWYFCREVSTEFLLKIA